MSLDFSHYEFGTQLSTLDGVDFSLANHGATVEGTPAIGYRAPGFTGLTNTMTGAYPTTQQLVFTFDSLVSDISFSYDNWGSNGASYTLYDAAHNAIGSGSTGNLSGRPPPAQGLIFVALDASPVRSQGRTGLFFGSDGRAVSGERCQVLLFARQGQIKGRQRLSCKKQDLTPQIGAHHASRLPRPATAADQAGTRGRA